MEEKTLEEQLEQARERLWQVADYIHSLNQPLTTIFGQLDLMSLKVKDPAISDNLEKCLEQTRRVTAILTQIAREYPRRPEEGDEGRESMEEFGA